MVKLKLEQHFWFKTKALFHTFSGEQHTVQPDQVIELQRQSHRAASSHPDREHGEK